MPNPNCGACDGSGYLLGIQGNGQTLKVVCPDCANYDWKQRLNDMMKGDIEMGNNFIAIRDCLKELVWCKNTIDRIENQIVPKEMHPDYPEYKRRKDAAWKRARELLT